MRDARDEGFENANVGVNVCRRDGSQRRQIVQDGCGLGYISFVKLHLQPCYRMCVGVGVAGREGLGESRDPGEAGGGGVERAQGLVRGRWSVLRRFYLAISTARLEASQSYVASCVLADEDRRLPWPSLAIGT